MNGLAFAGCWPLLVALLGATGCQGATTLPLELRTDLAAIAAGDADLASVEAELGCAGRELTSAILFLCVQSYTRTAELGLAVNTPECTDVTGAANVEALEAVLAGFFQEIEVELPASPEVESYVQVLAYGDLERRTIVLCGLTPPLSSSTESGEPRLPLYLFCAPEASEAGSPAASVFADYCQPVEFVSLDPATAQ